MYNAISDLIKEPIILHYLVAEGLEQERSSLLKASSPVKTLAHSAGQMNFLIPAQERFSSLYI